MGIYIVLFISSLALILPLLFREDRFPETTLGVTYLQIEEARKALIMREERNVYKRDSFPQKKYNWKSPEFISVIDINKADSADFEGLPGIGEKLSSRIVRYRSRLGGFIDAAQLREVYGIQDSVYDKIQKRFSLDKNFQPIQIDLNAIDYAGLRKHPYADHQFVKLVLAYRNAHGVFKSIEDLKNIETLDTVRLQKIAPYLKCSN